MTDTPTPVDLRGRDLGRVTDAIFNHPVSTTAHETNWWWKADIVFEPIEHLANLTAIFRTSEAPRSSFTRDQLEQSRRFALACIEGQIQ
jgi:hypothetical protein